MTPDERREHCRRIAGSGGRATLARYGAEHFSEIGKLGFRKALELGWGLELAAKLTDGYRAKFGRPLRLGPAPRRKAAIRAEARRLFAGETCDAIGCDRPGQVHHLAIHGEWPNDGAYIRILCDEHHRAEHRRIRREHLGRPR